MRFLIALIALAGAAVLPGSCARAPAGEPALWRLADADSQIWLFGSVHVLPADLAWRGPHLEAAFAAADELMTETDMSPEAVARLQELAARYGALPNGARLSALLAPEDAALFNTTARDLGIDPQKMERTRPWLAALQLSVTHAARRGHTGEHGVETVLAADARAQGKRFSFLETGEQQIRTLGDLPPEAEMRFLTLTLRQIAEDDGTMSAMDAAWARGDVDTLAALLDEQWRAAGPAIHSAVILDRNRAWTDQIARRLEGDGDVFIAVGAAHLVGEGNVITLLRQRGYSVEGP